MDHFESEQPTKVGTGPHAKPPPPQSFRLTVRDGADKGKRFEIDLDTPSPVLLGKGPACAIRLSDVTISRRHLELEVAEDGLRVRDLGSKNGTRVNEVIVVEAVLRGGETLRLGATSLQVESRALDEVAVPSGRTNFGRYLGRSRSIVRLYPLFEKLARSDVPVIIEGETGTGKEVLAEAIHEASARSEAPFVVFDCTAVPPSMMEAELFGHEKGAFTGATGSRRGYFEQADGGTLLIDEIGDLDLSLQPKLLRVIERSQFRRIGSEKALHANVRIIAATRRDLDKQVQAGRFRDDLFHRLAVARVFLPPLRRRREDIDMLAQFFWREFGGEESVPDEVMQRWREYEWPGNVRELRNAVARQVALGDWVEPGGEMERAGPASAPLAKDLVGWLLEQELPLPVARHRLVTEFEQRYIQRVLDRHGGDVAAAAEAAGIGRRYFNLLRSGRRRGASGADRDQTDPDSGTD